jgi:hypothetical protein
MNVMVTQIWYLLQSWTIIAISGVHPSTEADNYLVSEPRGVTRLSRRKEMVPADM